MAIVDQVTADAQNALRAGDRDRVGALRLLASELQKAAKEGSGEEVSVLRRERRRRLEAAQAFADAGRADLAGGVRTEAELIGAYLPAELSREELEAIVAHAVRDSGAESVRD